MQLQEYDTGLTGVRAATVLPDADVAVLGSQHELAAVDLGTGAVRRVPLDGEWGVKALAGLTGGRVLVVSINDVSAYSLDGGLFARWEITTWGAALGVAATADGSVFAVAAGDRLYTGSLAEHALTERELPECLAVAVSADGTLVAASSAGSVELTGGRRLEGGAVPILSMDLSPDGALLATGDDVTNTLIWDVATGTSREAQSAGKAVAMRWRPDGSMCAAIALTRLVGVFDPDGGHEAHLPAEEPGTYYLLGGGWTPDGKRVVAGTEHGKALAWTL